MSASQLIDEIKALPAEEREQVYDYVLKLKTDAKSAAPSDVIDRQTFEKAADAVFRKHGELLRMLAQ